jgi:hypothetical protein
MQRWSWKQPWFYANQAINLQIPKHLLPFMHRGGSASMEHPQVPTDSCKVDPGCSM